ncbi:MAG: hypothetical protein J6V01_08185 [Clostridia bacterium]|nr:hypothetical protein [Clostridia bacterium]
MTKRALIVIAIIIIIPVAITVYYFIGWRSDNPVVADWKGDTSTVSYHGTELHEVPGSSVYRFSVGKYLGKIADRLTGASLYRVEGDESGGLYAVVDSARTRLFTSGVPVPAGAFSGEKVTGVFTASGRYGDSKELNEAVGLILT